jgi:predicted RNase H-like HicB family nuclease
MTRQIKIVVERHEEGYVAFPLGLPAVIVGEGDTYDEAVADVTSAISFYFKHYADSSELDGQPVEAFLAETTLDVA